MAEIDVESCTSHYEDEDRREREKQLCRHGHTLP